MAEGKPNEKKVTLLKATSTTYAICKNPIDFYLFYSAKSIIWVKEPIITKLTGEQYMSI